MHSAPQIDPSTMLQSPPSTTAKQPPLVAIVIRSLSARQ
jgi:hypothetical protein